VFTRTTELAAASEKPDTSTPPLAAPEMATEAP
jgi:hypothetical protein